MNIAEFSPLSHLDCLSRIYPVTGAIVVGAGTGEGPWIDLLQQADAKVLIVEADQAKTLRLEKVFADQPHWVVQQQVVSGEEGEGLFYTMTYGAESGLLPPRQLKGLWPHIQLKQESSCQTVTLDGLCRKSEIVPNWLILDCLPALSILKGFEEAIAKTDVLIARAVIFDNFCQIVQASQKQIDDFLKKRGFNFYGSEAERNPALCHVVYVRESSRGSAQKLDELKQRIQEREIALEKKNSTLKRVEQDKRELQEKITAQSSKKDDRKKLLLELTQKYDVQKQELEQARRELKKMQNERAQAKLKSEKLEQERQKLEEKIAENKDRMKQFQQQLGSAKHDNDLNNETDQKPKFSSDADIDDFIEDIAPFFKNRVITYVDVGAYVGEVLLKILDTAKIKVREAHLIEPNPDSFQELKELVKDCCVSSCSTYHLGISNQAGTARFCKAQSMTKKISMDIDINDTGNFFEVECHRLDDLSKLFTDKRVNLLKIDVEGEELDVLLSADQLLKTNKIDVLYVEAGLNREGTQQTYFGDLDILLQGYGYRIFKIYEQKHEWMEDSPLLRRCNVAYMSKQFAAHNPYSLTIEKLKNIKK